MLFCWALLLWQPSASGINPAHIDSAKTYLNVREAKPNRSAEIDKFNKFVGNPKGAAWCAAFVSWNIARAGASSPKIKTGLARNFARLKSARPAGDVIRGKYQIKRGDIIVWARGKTIFGHVGFAYSDWRGSSGKTIEGNTGKPEGVHIQTRKIEPYNYFRIISIVEVKY